MLPKTITIKIDGIPIPWKAHAGFGKRSFNPRFKEKQYVQFHVQDQYKGIQHPGAVIISYCFNMPIPKSSKVNTQKMIEGKIPHLKRPDCTNMQKFYEDCMKGIVFVDDSQVVYSLAVKKYSENPSTLITVNFV